MKLHKCNTLVVTSIVQVTKRGTFQSTKTLTKSAVRWCHCFRMRVIIFRKVRAHREDAGQDDRQQTNDKSCYMLEKHRFISIKMIKIVSYSIPFLFVWLLLLLVIILCGYFHNLIMADTCKQHKHTYTGIKLPFILRDTV